MEGDNEKLNKGADAANGEAAAPLFAVFRPQPRPAPRPAPAKVNVPPPKPPPPAEKPPATAFMEARLAELEKKLREAAEKENARGSEREMMDYLKLKVGELEVKLRDAQEKALGFAYELKGRDEARKESRLEMEEFLAAVKRQQPSAEAGRLHTMELEKSRARIEALEQKLLELSSRPPAPPDTLVPQRMEELSRSVEAISSRLDDAAKAGIPAAVEAEKTRALLKQQLDSAFGALAGELERKLLDTVEKNLPAGRGAAGLESPGPEAEKVVEWFRAVMDQKGRAAAENIAGSYDLGFVEGSLDNLEKCLSSAIDILERAHSYAKESAGSSSVTPEMDVLRHLAALESSILDLKTGLSSFRNIRREMIKTIKKNLIGE